MMTGSWCVRVCMIRSVRASVCDVVPDHRRRAHGDQGVWRRARDTGQRQCVACVAECVCACTHALILAAENDFIFRIETGACVMRQRGAGGGERDVGTLGPR
jgi:hypothetical protein